jgi:hypothetical protein
MIRISLVSPSFSVFLSVSLSWFPAPLPPGTSYLYFCVPVSFMFDTCIFPSACCRVPPSSCYLFAPCFLFPTLRSSACLPLLFPHWPPATVPAILTFSLSSNSPALFSFVMSLHSSILIYSLVLSVAFIYYCFRWFCCIYFLSPIGKLLANFLPPSCLQNQRAQ